MIAARMPREYIYVYIVSVSLAQLAVIVMERTSVRWGVPSGFFPLRGTRRISNGVFEVTAVACAVSHMIEWRFDDVTCQSSE